VPSGAPEYRTFQTYGYGIEYGFEHLGAPAKRLRRRGIQPHIAVAISNIAIGRRQRGIPKRACIKAFGGELM
jgi:hypothetical protein